jgi:hypothetical protein
MVVACTDMRRRHNFGVATVQGARRGASAGCLLTAAAAILTLTFTAAVAEPDKGAAEAAPAATETAEPKAAAQSKSNAKAASKSKAASKPDKKAKRSKDSEPAIAEPAPVAKDAKQDEAADEPKVVEAAKLPKGVRDLHKCAAVDDKVELSHEKYSKSVLILVTCPTTRGALTPTAVYAARDKAGKGAKRVTFELLPLDGKPMASDTLYSTAPAREAYAMAGDPVPNMQVKDETPWIVGSWRPEDRPGICAVTATWRVQGDKGQLWFWEEAKECQKDQLPNYEIRIDKKPPPLVGR